MRLGGVNKLPNPIENKKFIRYDGKKAIYYTLTTKDGNEITLRNYSRSVDKSNSKWNIDIKVYSSNKTNIELKFQ